MRSGQEKIHRFSLCPRFIMLRQNFRRMARVFGDMIVLETAEVSNSVFNGQKTFRSKANRFLGITKITFFQNGGALHIPFKPNLPSQKKPFALQNKNIYLLVGSYVMLLSERSRSGVIFVSSYTCPITSTQGFLRKSEELTLSD